MPNKIDRVGQKFNMLTVLRRMPKDDNVTRWECMCDCGNITIVTDTHLTRKKHCVKSCGCLRREFHNKSNTRIYRIYSGMKHRCNCESSPVYKDYGGRGISMCEEWNNSFVKFYDWAMQNGYSDDLFIDRIDNDGDYSPDNCRWTNMHEQSVNRRNTRHVTFNGETKPLIDWCREFGINYGTAYLRLYKHGWPVEKVFTPPYQERRKKSGQHNQRLARNV